MLGIALIILFTAICTFLATYNYILSTQEIEETENGYNIIIFGESHYYE